MPAHFYHNFYETPFTKKSFLEYSLYWNCDRIYTISLCEHQFVRYYSSQSREGSSREGSLPHLKQYHTEAKCTIHANPDSYVVQWKDDERELDFRREKANVYGLCAGKL